MRLIFIRRKITIRFATKDLKIYTRAAAASAWSRIRWKKTLFPKPKVLIGLNLKCNLKCMFCPAHSPLVTEPQEKMLGISWQSGRTILQDDASLPFEKFKEIIDDLRCLRPEKIVFYGNGETLAYPFIAEAIKYIQSRNSSIMGGFDLITNGALLNESLSKKMLELDLRAICVSINAATPETYRAIHCVDESIFHTVIENIQNFMRVACDLCKSEVMRISFILCKKNYKEIVDMVRLSDSLGIKNVSFKVMYYCKGKRQQLSDYILDDSDKEQLQTLIFDAVLEANRRKIFTNLNALINMLKRGSEDCFVPTLRDAYILQVHSNGLVNPFDFPYRMGNVYQRSLLDIWYSPQYIEFRTMIKQKALKRRFMPNRPLCLRCNNVGEGEICRIIF